MSSPNRLGIGIIGCGGFGRFGVAAVAPMRELVVVAMADPVEENRLLGAAEWRKSRAAAGLPATEPALYADHHPLLERPDVAAVWVLTPPHRHHPVARDALRAGKHLFVEKPGSLSLEEIDDLLVLAARHKRRTGIDFVMRHNPLYRWIKGLVEAGDLGPLERIALENCARDDRLPPGHWFWDEARSGGIWVEHGVHFFDLVNWLAGPPASIAALAVDRPVAGGAALRDTVAAVAVHPRPATPHEPSGPAVLATHYHGFTRPGPFERTTLTLVFQRAYLDIEGWIAVRLRGDALLDNAAEARLRSVPWLRMAAAPGHGGEGCDFTGRGRSFTARRRVVLNGDLGDRQELYRESIRAGWRDLLRSIDDPAHRPEADLNDAREALRAALAATVSQREGVAVELAG